MSDETPNVTGGRDWKRAMEFYVAATQLIAEYETSLGYRHSDTPIGKFKTILIHYREETARTVAAMKSFRDDFIPYFKALELVLTTVGNAETHREKNARLRGAVELVQKSVDFLRRCEFEFNRHCFERQPDLFRSDLPTREYLERIRDLEREVAELKKAEAS